MRAPSHLSKAAKRWWREVFDAYQLESHQVKVLTLAAEAWDRCQQAREILADSGSTFLDRFGSPRARPEVSVERDSRLAFARLVRELNLTLEPPDGRPPRLYGE